MRCISYEKRIESGWLFFNTNSLICTSKVWSLKEIAQYTHRLDYRGEASALRQFCIAVNKINVSL